MASIAPGPIRRHTGSVQEVEENAAPAASKKNGEQMHITVDWLSPER
jgi:hypothetical protein